ncbi:MAG: hypothetical protein HXO20_01065 [Prevotella shahii]|nr:hypothetical protein [Hoylesella shahii]
MKNVFTQAGGTFTIDDQYPLSGSSRNGFNAAYIGFAPNKVGWGYDIFITVGTNGGLVRPFVFF